MSGCVPPLKQLQEMDLPEMSPNDRLTLILKQDGNKELRVHKVLLALHSSVFRAMLDTEPKLQRLEVDGSEHAWSMILPHIYPGTSIPAWQPSDVLEVLPLAHFFNFTSVMKGCTSAVAGFKYHSFRQQPGCAEPVPFIKIAEQLQMPELGIPAVKYCRACPQDSFPARAALLEALQEAKGSSPMMCGVVLAMMGC